MELHFCPHRKAPASQGDGPRLDPLASVHHAELGVAVENAFTGAALGTKWSDPNKRSAFFETFAY